MKKLIVMMLCFVILLTYAVPASAAETTTVEIIPAVSEAKPGDKITFELRITGSEKCTSLGVVLSYDTNVFEISKGKCSLKDTDLSIFDKTRGFAYLFNDPAAPEGTIGTLTMKVREGAESGTFEVSGQVAVKNGEVTIPSAITPAKVVILGSEPQQETQQPGTDSTEVQQTEAAQTETQSGEEGVAQPQQSDVQQETPNNAEPQVNTEPAQQIQEETAAKIEMAQQTGAEQSDAGLIKELLIAVGVLVVLIAALVICLKRRPKKGKYKK